MSLILVRSIISALFLNILLLDANAFAASFLQFGDSAGLPYPFADVNVSLKEADVKIRTQSTWDRQAEGFEPHHIVLMNIHALYIIQNNNNEKLDLILKVPLPISLHEKSLLFTMNGVSKNYTNVEYDNPRQKGTGLRLYTLNMVLEGNTTNTLEVSVESSGMGSIEEDFTFILADATKWSSIEKIIVSSENENSLITGYSIPPTETTLKVATWQFDSVPQRDLTIRWKVLTSPVSTQLSSQEIQPSPLLPPIVALVIGGLIVGSIAYIRMKRKKI
ncbi:MAG: hypothetical protein QXU32_03700 [Nitrososphaerales archaeon]